jgi:hypothetical protein
MRRVAAGKLAEVARSTNRLHNFTMTIAFRVAAAQLALLSIGFGIPGVIGAEHFTRIGYVWQLWGQPTYDPVGFESLGVDVAVVPAILVFLVTCSLGVIAAILLWIRPTAVIGAILAIVVTALQAVFWVGFVLPFGPPGGLIVVALVAIGLLLRRRRSARP